MAFVEFPNIEAIYQHSKYETLVYSEEDLILISKDSYFVIPKREVVDVTKEKDELILLFQKNFIGQKEKIIFKNFDDILIEFFDKLKII